MRYKKTAKTCSKKITITTTVKTKRREKVKQGITGRQEKTIRQSINTQIHMNTHRKGMRSIALQYPPKHRVVQTNGVIPLESTLQTAPQKPRTHTLHTLHTRAGEWPCCNLSFTTMLSSQRTALHTLVKKYCPRKRVQFSHEFGARCRPLSPRRAPNFAHTFTMCCCSST